MDGNVLTYLASLGVWVWFIAAAILFALEIFAPGAFMMWLGLSSLLVGIISLFFISSWQAQFAFFAVFSIASIPLWRRFTSKSEQPHEPSFLNRRSEAMVGRTFTLETPIVDGFGTIKVGDTIWRVSGPETAAGNRVVVTGSDAAVLLVAPAGIAQG